jgi:hypothetical protein
MTNLDIVVRIDSVKPGLQVSGTIRLRLNHKTSHGPSLWLNSRKCAMKWQSLHGPGIAKVDLNTVSVTDSAALSAFVVLDSPAVRGDEIVLHFSASKVMDSEQLLCRPDVALASWVEGWYPVVNDGPGMIAPFTAKSIAIRGTTTFDLPDGWVAITDGHLARREQRDNRGIEVWNLGETPVARSFVAGPYSPSEIEVNGRRIRTYLSGTHPLDSDRMVQLLTSILQALEGRLGPYPFSGYGVVEIPDGTASWGAASQQTFIMATSESFDFEHGNVPLWAHEICHGWWGNTVGTSGPGHKMAGEALAQFGAVIALEELEGTDAMLEFLEFSRSGYSVNQCARGYFALSKQGVDHSLATLGDSELSSKHSHHLADSKGMWVYHMLRRLLGNEVFFGVLRGLITDYAGQEMSLNNVRSAFQEAAPDKQLEPFFSQWLDRPGAPRFDVQWLDLVDHHFEITLRQLQKEEPYRFPIDIELTLSDGSTSRKNAQVQDRETTIICTSATGISKIVPDPDRNLLIWRSEYSMSPVVDGRRLSGDAEWVDVEAYTGTYHISDLGMDVEVYADGDELWVRIAEDIRQLFPDEPYRFLTVSEKVRFQLENGRAVGFVVELSNGTIAEGTRVD